MRHDFEPEVLGLRANFIPKYFVCWILWSGGINSTMEFSTSKRDFEKLILGCEVVEGVMDLRLFTASVYLHRFPCCIIKRVPSWRLCHLSCLDATWVRG